MPVGRNLWVKHDKGRRRLVAKTQYHDDPFSEGLWQLCERDVLRAYSVNIIPDAAECSAPTARELKARPELEREGWEMRRSVDEFLVRR